MIPGERWIQISTLFNTTQLFEKLRHYFNNSVRRAIWQISCWPFVSRYLPLEWLTIVMFACWRLPIPLSDFHRAFNLYPLSVIKRNDKYFVRLFDLPSMLIITKSHELPNKNTDCSTFAHWIHRTFECVTLWANLQFLPISRSTIEL